MASKSEHAFVDKVPEEYNCFICANVLEEPVLTECCGQHFCKQCLENWFERGAGQKTKKTCPHCRSENFAFIKDLKLKRKISDLVIYCPNYSKGCQKQFSLGTHESHLETCSFVTINCSNNCGLALLRKDLKEHCQKMCQRRMVKCWFCAAIGIYEQIIGNHLGVCPDLPFTCPRECGKREIKRKDLEAHKQLCPHEPVQCPFYEAGCKIKLLRKDLEAHKVFNVQQHLQFVMVTATNNKAQHEILKMEHDSLKMDHEALKSQHQELQDKFHNLVSCVTDEIDCIDTTTGGGTPGNNICLQCISTAMLSTTSMLAPGPESYWLHFTWDSDNSLRTPSFYLSPGYKMYVRCNRAIGLMLGISNTTFSLIQEKSEWNDSLPYLIPNGIAINFMVHYEIDGLIQKPQTPQILCSKCRPHHLVAAGNTEQDILTWEYPVEIQRYGLYGYITLSKHTCLSIVSPSAIVNANPPLL